jgi:hypothetical protein
MNNSDAFFCGLFRRRTCAVPTWRGWLALLLLAAATAFAAVRSVYPFLAVSDPVRGGVLVVEGWASDDAMREVIAEFQRGHYSGLYVTGGPLERGALLAEYRTFAELSAATLLRLGFDPKLLHAVPAMEVRKDRTYASALALKQWLREHHVPSEKINIMTQGAHTRRTRLLYEKAFGNESHIGAIAVRDMDFDPRRWWTTSIGFRGVTDEMLAYFYARFFFHAATE